MQKVCLAVLPALTIVLELLPLGAVCIFATSPTERVKETFSYFSLTPFGYANFAPLITATLTVAIFLLSLLSLKTKGVLKALFVLSIITVNISKGIETKPYNAERLKGYLPELRGMTVKKPEEFLPRMREIFAECGVAFVLLPHLKNSGVNGAVKWVSEDRVVLAMNNRGLDADKFWFSLFHEIKHVLQQKIKTVFISSTVEEMKDINNKLEIEADKFAMNYLIPPADYKRLAPTKYTSDDEIVEFAKSIGIHPGIVAGRLQHEGIIAQNRCSKLKEKYVIEIKHIA